MTTTGEKTRVDPPIHDQALADDLRSIEKRRPFRWGLFVGALAAVDVGALHSAGECDRGGCVERPRRSASAGGRCQMVLHGGVASAQ